MNERDPTEPLLRLARRAHHAAPSRVDAASFYAFEAKLARRGVRVRALRLGLLAATLLGALTLWAWPRAVDAPPLAYRETSQLDQARVSFSDGSEVWAEPDAELHVRTTSARGAKVLVTRGRVRIHVVPRPRNDWWFDAGPYSVHVTGTAFAVRWLPVEQLFELEVEHGSVVVTGPLAEKGVRLGTGQRLVSEPARRHLEISRVVEPARPEPEGPPPSAAAAPRHDDARVVASTPDFARLVAEGRFDDVLRSARERGVAALLRRAPASELAALADAARYQGELALAERALLALRQRHPRSPEGRSSSYFLARVSEPDRARSWYQRYLSEQPHGAFVAPTLGALMLLQRDRGLYDEAARSAEAYLARDPDGPYAAAARKLLSPRSPDAPHP